jgi:hypothetical protein
MPESRKKRRKSAQKLRVVRQAPKPSVTPFTAQKKLRFEPCKQFVVVWTPSPETLAALQAHADSINRKLTPEEAAIYFGPARTAW